MACAVWAAGCGGNDAEVTVLDSANSVASSAAASEADSDSWRWQGEIVEREDRGARACFGEVDPASPFGCEGWSLPDLDWTTVPDVIDDGAFRRATVQLVVREAPGGFVVDGDPSQAVDDWVLPECEVVDAAAGEPTRISGVGLLVQREDAVAAGVVAGPITVFGGGTVERPDASIGLLLPTDDARDWLVDNLTGLTLEICPQSLPN